MKEFICREEKTTIPVKGKRLVIYAELVRCKNCKYLIDHYGFMDDGYCEKMREDYNVKFKPKKEWFCAYGERRDI